MRAFLKHILYILLLIVISAYFLDAVYTYSYLHSTNRNKIQNIINSNSKDFDVVILGSSRANNHFVTSEFTKKGYKAFNYGMSGSRLQETALTLELMVENKFTIKNIILEVDLNINSDGYSEGTRASFMPYLHTSQIVKKYYSFLPNFKLLYYIPFYRYIIYDNKIGFREMFFSMLNKKTVFLDNGGFYPLSSTNQKLAYDMSTYVPKKNKSYELIKQICSKNKINLSAVTTPICQEATNRDYFNKVKALYPEIINCEDLVKEDKYFSTCGHMNYMGAKLFTKRILQQIVLKK